MVELPPQIDSHTLLVLVLPAPLEPPLLPGWEAWVEGDCPAGGGGGGSTFRSQCASLTFHGASVIKAVVVRRVVVVGPDEGPSSGV